MRFVAALAGILGSLPALVFFWIGAQTFLRPAEKALAVVLTLATGALLVLSITLLFTPSVQRLQGILVLALAATITLVVTLARSPG